ncbi:DUF1338 domain-containing protein [Paraglaciecola aquimarina]|uniref:2-oxoadipate dioxygenase/decarboxylase n=1 Tax=Paraglaciecola algarum TaxID=3050085 RepID=A0ABS9D6G7_9ALTE|nr:DUF1338 domain-containing protein [Paraglaciecola sp. G1-23]MCF2947617.1 DUF1338 domain-containing protein [Paraglaciecola sp. G1-23]
MHTQINELFSHLWQDYLAITPSAQKIHALLNQLEFSDVETQGQLINDHIALRTFNIEKINLDKLAEHFIALGYVEKGQYDFAQKKLKAKHFEHPDTNQPKVFISELLVEEMPQAIQDIIYKMLENVDEQLALQDNFLYSGAHWQVSSADYETLAAHSEYAAWMSVWGFRANHFTISINHMRKIKSVEQMNSHLKQAGFILNSAGGEIKGGEEVLLAQSSTMADKITVTFADAQQAVPSCFYEFAQRYPMDNGELYQGFVAASADKIFESTNQN